MPNYALAQIVSILVMFSGWVIALGGSTITIMYLDKAKLIALMPAFLAGKLAKLPELVFYFPAAICIVTGLIIVAIGHILQTTIDSSRFSAESAQILELMRVRGF